jgi:hypothetical protein
MLQTLHVLTANECIHFYNAPFSPWSILTNKKKGQNATLPVTLKRSVSFMHDVCLLSCFVQE